MKKSVLSSLILIASLLVHYVHGGSLEDNCKKIAGPNLSYDFCLSALKADPNSQNADLQGLGVISMKLTVSKATSIRTKIGQLLNTADAKLKNVLRDCSEQYSDASNNVKEALVDFQAKSYNGANVKLSAVFDASDNCEQGFKPLHLVSPLTKENDYFHHLAAIPLNITGSLLHS